MWPIKFKTHSRFALPRCNFPKRMLGVFCNFPKQNTPDFYIFPKIFVEELLVWSTPLYDKKCFNRAESIEKSHIPHDCEHIALYSTPIPHKSYTKCLLLPIKYGLPKASIHELYSTLIGGIKHIISSQINTFISFARKIVSLLFNLLHW